MMGRFKINVNVAMLWLSACILIFPFSSQAFIPLMKHIMQARILYTDTSLWGGGLFGLEKDENSVGEPPSESQETDSLSIPPPTRVIEIPVSYIKRGGLRFALGLHLIGLEQEKGTWRPNQASDNELDMYFKDNSAMFKVVFDDDTIHVDRYGTPSLLYLLQESVVLHSVLDELNTLCFDGEIADENRLLQLVEPGDAIENARAKLPARKA